MAISVSDKRTGIRHKYIRTYFDLCVLVFPQISHIDAEPVLFYQFNLIYQRSPCHLNSHSHRRLKAVFALQMLILGAAGLQIRPSGYTT